MTADDLDVVLSWRNDPVVRTKMFNQSEISKESHREWFMDVSHNPNHEVLIME